MVRFYIVLVLNIFLGSISSSGQDIISVAGDSLSGYNGDNIPAIGAKLNGPYSIAVDAVGNIFIADINNNRVRKVSVSGTITTVAGNGIAGYGGDGGPATQAKLNGPVGVAVNAKGDLFISDDYNGRIRKVDSNGVIVTYAGTNTFGYSGDGGPATDAQLYAPHGLAMDEKGNLYIADVLNDCIRKVSNGIITTVAGRGIPGYSGDGGLATNALLDRPYGVCVDGKGILYLTEWGNNCVRRIDTSGIIETIAGGSTSYGFSGDNGPATAAVFHIPIGIAGDKAGNIYVADSYNERVRRIDKEGVITTYAGRGVDTFSGDNGLAANAGLALPIGVFCDSYGNLFVSDYGDGHIRLIKSTESVAIENQDSPDISVFPNPSTGSFNVKMKKGYPLSETMVISNLIGKKIKELSVLPKEDILVKLDVPNGLYLLTMITESSTATTKILISR